MKHFIITIGMLSLMLGVGSVHASNNLSRIYVHHVTSSKGGTELIPQGGSWTAKDHGGTVLTIATDGIGYGNNAQARLLDSPLREGGNFEFMMNPNGPGGWKRATVQIR